ncbi:MAG: efflux RND transporter permease subunit [Burkholderiales bacterium]|nr:efflux RND transporter permease subunit [Burkholderiales bacterium]
MKRVNLSEWALAHRGFVVFLMVVLAILGTLSYARLGQSEDPPFTFKIMVVRTFWDGATAREVEEQLTDRIERKLQEVPNVDYVRSYSKPGESLVFFFARDSAPSSAIPDIWYQVRKKIGDIRHTLPAGIRGPFFNDEFGDVYGNLYVLAGDGFDYATLKDYANDIRADLLRVPDVAKVDFFGEQDEKIYIEMSNAQLANLGIDAQALFAALAQQNVVAPAGAFETPTDKIFVRPSGRFATVADVKNLTIRANNRLVRLGDYANVYRGFADPPQPKMRYMGREVLGIGVSMAKGGDIIALGEHLGAEVARIRERLPVGIELVEVSSQPKAVARSVNEFVRVLAEAVVIVLAVSLASLGLRTGVVAVLSIPLVFAITFLAMWLFGIGLHKISLGALILALGLLVDDAIIAIEMMAVKLEEGWDRVKAASFAYASTAMPMLTGTLVTVAGFLPIATAQSSTGEYTRSIFQVNAIALLASWVVAVIFIPYLGFRLLPDFAKKRGEPTRFERAVVALVRRFSPRQAGALAERFGRKHEVHDEASVYGTPFYRAFARLVDACVRYRKTTILVTVALFLVSLAAFRLVPQQFFPASTRPELIVDLRLPEGSSYAATEAEVKKLEAILAKEPGIENVLAYVGTGSPRFYLPLDQQLSANNFGQFVILTTGLAEREALRAKLIALFERDFPGLRASITRLENGPPVGFPVQFRVSGKDVAKLRGLAGEVAAVMRENPNVQNVQFDWDELSKVVRVAIDQDKARVAGLTSQEIAAFLNNSLSGAGATTFRERDRAIEVLLRGPGDERAQLRLLADLAIPTRAGKSVPLAQVATLEYGLEEGVIWRRNRLPTITVRANVYGDIQAPVVTAQILPRLEPIRAQLPAGYLLETGGAVEDSAKGQRSVAAGMPLFVIFVLTVLMVQLQSFQRVLMVVLTAPLGLIGVVAALLLFGKPFGFVAMLGTIALSGMIMRNAVILVDQIEQDIRAGSPPWTAIVAATVRRFRPIVLTAAAAVLAMIPLSRSAFFGPMAVAIMGGLVVATALTLLFVPALYAAWFRVRPAPAA